MLAALVNQVTVGQLIVALIVLVVGRLLAQKQKEIHVLVNAQRTALEARIAQLEATIKTSDKEVPDTTRETGSGH